jgi:hypothetical protein
MALEEQRYMNRLTVIPCSAKKAHTGYQNEGSRLTNDLKPDTARQLLDARERLRERARVDESTLLPAWIRYTGSLYESARESLASAVDRGEHILILSGGYGVVKVDEPIGWYEAVLNLAWWPRGLLERCILEYAQHHQLKDVVCFAGSKTPYATAAGSSEADANLRPGALLAAVGPLRHPPASPCFYIYGGSRGTS